MIGASYYGQTTIDMKSFTGLNIPSFSAIKVLMEIILHCLGHKYSLFSIIKERHLYLRKIFYGNPENREKQSATNLSLLTVSPFFY